MEAEQWTYWELCIKNRQVLLLTDSVWRGNRDAEECLLLKKFCNRVKYFSLPRRGRLKQFLPAIKVLRYGNAQVSNSAYGLKHRRGGVHFFRGERILIHSECASTCKPMHIHEHWCMYTKQPFECSPASWSKRSNHCIQNHPMHKKV